VSALRCATIDDLSAVFALQQAAYAQNRAILGVEPLPLLTDYHDIFSHCEVWLADEPEGVGGVLILRARAGDLMIWSVATAPFARRRGIGNRMLAFAESRARASSAAPASGSTPANRSSTTLRGTRAMVTCTSARKTWVTASSCI
jgi:ribosomal protein S18 acetylase RimI-like enzyme